MVARKKKGRFLKIFCLIIGLVCCLYTVKSIFFASPDVGHFKTMAGQEKYLKNYEQVLQEMSPQPSQTYDVDTTWGKVRVYEWSREETKGKTPVLLFPGHSSGVPMWEKNISYFAQNHPVYAFDALGDAGKSVQTLPLKSMDDINTLLTQVLDALHIKETHLVGHSFGAASAANFATAYPKRVKSLTLLEPAFTLNYPKFSVFFWASLSQFDFLPESWKNKALAEISGENAQDIGNSKEPLAQMIKAAAADYASALPTPKPIAKEKLAQWTFPVYLALAEKSSITKEESRKNAEVIPQVTIRKWEKTTHSLPMEVAEPLARELEDFWQKAEQ